MRWQGKGKTQTKRRKLVGNWMLLPACFNFLNMRRLVEENYSTQPQDGWGWDWVRRGHREEKAASLPERDTWIMTIGGWVAFDGN